MKQILKIFLTSRKLPLIDWEITVNSGVEPSTDCAYREKQKIKNRIRPKITRSQIVQTWNTSKATETAGEIKRMTLNYSLHKDINLETHKDINQ